MSWRVSPIPYTRPLQKSNLDETIKSFSVESILAPTRRELTSPLHSQAPNHPSIMRPSFMTSPHNPLLSSSLHNNTYPPQMSTPAAFPTYDNSQFRPITPITHDFSNRKNSNTNNHETITPAKNDFMDIKMATKLVPQFDGSNPGLMSNFFKKCLVAESLVDPN